jgi:hypothetical protein
VAKTIQQKHLKFLRSEFQNGSHWSKIWCLGAKLASEGSEKLSFPSLQRTPIFLAEGSFPGSLKSAIMESLLRQVTQTSFSALLPNLSTM